MADVCRHMHGWAMREHLGREDGQRHQRAEEAERDPVRGKLPHAKVHQQQLQLGAQRQGRAPDIGRRAPPELDGAARPAVLLLAVREEARRQLRVARPASASVKSHQNDSSSSWYGP